MPWKKTPADRQRDNAAYGAEYRRNRDIARRRANGVCEGCHHRHRRLECDHIVPKSVTGKADNSPGNLRMLCAGDDSCGCHQAKTLTEGSGWRGRGKSSGNPRPTPRTDWSRDPPPSSRIIWE